MGMWQYGGRWSKLKSRVKKFFWLENKISYHLNVEKFIERKERMQFAGKIKQNVNQSESVAEKPNIFLLKPLRWKTSNKKAIEVKILSHRWAVLVC